MSQSFETPSWAVVIPTYQRQTILLRCLYFVAHQSLPPKEIIVIDANPDWDISRQKVWQEIVAFAPSTITWHYLPARRLSSAAQRNQGIELAQADIIFLIDDDSLMYPDCAEQVMRIYGLDGEHQVAGIMPKLAALPPDAIFPASQTQKINHQTGFFAMIFNKTKVVQVKLRGWAKKLIKDDDIFIPYQFNFPKYALPASLKGMAVHPVPMFHGARMSYRREILAQVRFEESLERYAVNEDNDVCYRASLLGPLLQALEAKICHLQVSEGRITRFTATVLWGLNQVVLHRFHSADLVEFRKRWRKLLWRRLFTQTLKDLLDRRWTFPSTRGLLFVQRHYPQILAKTPEELSQWYPTFQQQLIERNF